MSPLKIPYSFHIATGGRGSVYDVEDIPVSKRYVLERLHPQLVSRHDLGKRMEADVRALADLLRYATPEQIFGGDLGPATDSYSLGIVVYELRRLLREFCFHAASSSKPTRS